MDHSQTYAISVLPTIYLMEDNAHLFSPGKYQATAGNASNVAHITTKEPENKNTGACHALMNVISAHNTLENALLVDRDIKIPLCAIASLD